MSRSFSLICVSLAAKILSSVLRTKPVSGFSIFGWLRRHLRVRGRCAVAERRRQGCGGFDAGCGAGEAGRGGDQRQHRAGKQMIEPKLTHYKTLRNFNATSSDVTGTHLRRHAHGCIAIMRPNAGAHE